MGLANGTAREWHDHEWHNSVTVVKFLVRELGLKNCCYFAIF
jgi:hypothetical protein